MKFKLGFNDLEELQKLLEEVVESIDNFETTCSNIIDVLIDNTSSRAFKILIGLSEEVIPTLQDIAKVYKEQADITSDYIDGIRLNNDLSKYKYDNEVLNMNLKKIVLVSLMFIALTGCQSDGDYNVGNSDLTNLIKSFRNEDAYSSKEESIDYMQSQLESKYNEEFVINESSISYDDQTYPTSITSLGTAHSKSKPDYEFEIYSRSTGVFKDSYGNYKFMEGAQKEAEEFCAGRDYVDSCDAKLTTSTETDNLIEKYPTYEDYREDHAIYYNIHLKGRSPVEHPEDYVDPVIEMITDLLEGEYGNGYLIVDYISEDYPNPINVWWEYYDRDDERFLINSQPEEFLNYDRVLEDIERNVS